MIRADALQAVRLLRLVNDSPVLSQNIRCLTARIDHAVQVEWISHGFLPPHCKVDLAARSAASIQSPSSLLQLDEATVPLTKKEHLQHRTCALVPPCAVTLLCAKEHVLRRI